MNLQFGAFLFSTKEECEKGSRVIGWSDNTANSVSYSFYPPGCVSPDSTSLYFNRDTNAVLCKSYTMCVCKITCTKAKEKLKKLKKKMHGGKLS